MILLLAVVLMSTVLVLIVVEHIAVKKQLNRQQIYLKQVLSHLYKYETNSNKRLNAIEKSLKKQHSQAGAEAQPAEQRNSSGD